MNQERRPEWILAKYGMLLDCPYNSEFIEDMKREVPSDERKWDNDKKMWWISDAYLDEVDALLFNYFEDTGFGRGD